jgi:surfeit locus 1 family protein
MIRFRPRLAPTLFTIPVLLMCIGLGVWQLQRLGWKRDLMAERDAAVTAPPVRPPRTLAEARAMQFHPVVADGVFLHDKEIFVGATDPRGKTGFHVLTPLREPDGRIVFVNRGFIPSERKDPVTRTAGQLTETVHIRGLLRLPPEAKPNWFLPDNRPDLNYWFWIDLPAMAAAAHLVPADVAPFYTDADATPNPGGWPQGGVTPLNLPNDHLQYAIIWFSFATALIVIYVVYHWPSRGAA